MNGAHESWTRQIGRVLHYPIIKKSHPLPPDARVDPALFPDEEFPVRCFKCGYTLSGLGPEGLCPECGAPFDRGRLLVETYVTCRKPANSMFFRFISLACSLFIALGILNLIGFSLLKHSVVIANFTMFEILLNTLLAAGITEGILLIIVCTGLIIFVIRGRPPRDKQRRVRAAIQNPAKPS